MLKSLFQWLDLHPGSYWVLATMATLMLVARLGLTLGREAREPPAPPRGPDWRDAVVLFLFILAWRWPFLLVAYEYNPDESQLIAGAMTLVRDPVFWRAVDGHTAGPLDFYALLPLHALGVPLDYFNIRLTGLLLTWLTLFLAQRLFRTFAPPLAAQLAILPAAIFFATAIAPMASSGLPVTGGRRRTTGPPPRRTAHGLPPRISRTVRSSGGPAIR